MGKKTPENAAKAEAKALIEEVCKRRGLAFKIDWHAGSAFESTLDGTGAIAGHPFVCEVKRFDSNEEPTARQKLQMADYAKAGVKVFDLVDRTALHSLRYWLETLEPREPHDP